MALPKIYFLKALRLAGLLVIGTILYFQGKPVPADNNKPGIPDDTTLKNIRQLFPDASSFEADTTAEKAAEVYGHNGQRLGFFLSTTPYADDINGYAGTVPLLIGLDNNYTITSVVILPNSETPDVLKYITKKGLFNSWNSLTTQQALQHKVDTISGATITTNAIIQSIIKRLELLNHQVPSRCNSGASLMKNGIAFLAVAFGLLSFFVPGAIQRYRIILMIVNVSVLGFLYGYLISLALVHGWIQTGIPYHSMPILVLLALLAFFLPLVTNKRFYCAHICPYGSAQELAGKILRKKPGLSELLRNRRKQIRISFLSVIVLLVLTGMCANFVPFEPFPAFLIRSASTFTLIFALMFLGVSVFYPRFWCNYLCPTGQLLDCMLVHHKKNGSETL
ncbi:MAG: 4Fe-4S binding protein [Candidatus Auribacter fodinae]|jgi:Na+-translocating ferredoxin:NAD+ oxidoreductase RnfG subunit|uniref:4Fe-4S binding protein n=1 Tax=Candidatus Auribacter fodinae TaxID=2093366 RepID=A0A3A4R4J3_9BACT|nr:MAG: 4Fe-4S binding protein [Candidatus Auribacter fodinae]